MTRRKDRYQPRAASASQPKMLKTYAWLEIVLRDVAPGAVDLSQASATRAMRPSSAPCPRRQCNWTRQVDDRGAIIRHCRKSWRTVCFGLMS